MGVVNRSTRWEGLAWPIAAALSLTAAPAHAETATGDASAKVNQPITLASLLDMHFGHIVANATGGNVTLATATGTRICSPGLICTGAYGFAKLIVSGSNGSVQVTHDPVYHLTGPGQDMDVTLDFPGGSGAILTLVTNYLEVDFGANIAVNPNQTPGDYSGLITVNVNYQ
jgi:hypothetical protein